MDIADYLTLHDPNPKIEKAYHEADVFCLPSLYEGYPNVVVEAMACGLPVLCSNVFENPYIVSEGVNGMLFDPHRADDIARAIQQMASLSVEQRAEMGRRNRQACLERNSEEAFLKAYTRLIASL